MNDKLQYNFTREEEFVKPETDERSAQMEETLADQRNKELDVKSNEIG